MPEKLLQLECCFCHKTQKEVAKLIAGPSVCICNECVSSFLEQMKSGGGLTADKGAAKDRCSFCGKARSKVATVFSRDDHRICSECLDICMEIITDDARFSSENRAVHDDK